MKLYGVEQHQRLDMWLLNEQKDESSCWWPRIWISYRRLRCSTRDSPRLSVILMPHQRPPRCCEVNCPPICWRLPPLPSRQKHGRPLCSPEGPSIIRDIASDSGNPLQHQKMLLDEHYSKVNVFLPAWCHILQRVPGNLYLGVTLSDGMKGNSHINKITRNANPWFFKRNLKYCP